MEFSINSSSDGSITCCSGVPGLFDSSSSSLVWICPIERCCSGVPGLFDSSCLVWIGPIKRCGSEISGLLRSPGVFESSLSLTLLASLGFLASLCLLASLGFLASLGSSCFSRSYGFSWFFSEALDCFRSF